MGKSESFEGAGDEADEFRAEMVFFAAHSWDLAAAAKVGFKTAYVDFEVSCQSWKEG